MNNRTLLILGVIAVAFAAGHSVGAASRPSTPKSDPFWKRAALAFISCFGTGLGSAIGSKLAGDQAKPLAG